MLKFISLLAVKSWFNLRSEISKYYLNYLWWILEPILTMGTFYIVFGIFMNRGTQHFVAFLLIGLVQWQWFSNCITQSASSIIANKGFILQVDIPKIFFPLEIILRGTFKHLFVLIFLLLFLVAYPTPVSVTWIALPVLMTIQLLYIACFGIVCAAVVPFIPDLRFVVIAIVRLAMFASGIFYNIDSVVLPEHRFIAYLNPIAGLIKNYRDILMNSQWPDWQYLGYLATFGLILFTLAVCILHKLDHVYPRVCQQ